MPVRVTAALPADLADLAAVAAVTFPLACPPSATAENVAAFIAEHLCEDHFAAYLADPGRLVLAARDSAGITGYAMLIHGVPDNEAVQRAVPQRPAIELSKIYVLPEGHGAGAASALMTTALRRSADLGARCVWLGVNQENLRAQRFYTKHGFTVNGTKTFQLGADLENDYVMVRSI